MRSVLPSLLGYCLSPSSLLIGHKRLNIYRLLASVYIHNTNSSTATPSVFPNNVFNDSKSLSSENCVLNFFSTQARRILLQFALQLDAERQEILVILLRKIMLCEQADFHFFHQQLQNS